MWGSRALPLADSRDGLEGGQSRAGPSEASQGLAQQRGTVGLA